MEQVSQHPPSRAEVAARVERLVGDRGAACRFDAVVLDEELIIDTFLNRTAARTLSASVHRRRLAWRHRPCWSATIRRRSKDQPSALTPSVVAVLRLSLRQHGAGMIYKVFGRGTQYGLVRCLSRRVQAARCRTSRACRTRRKNKTRHLGRLRVASQTSQAQIHVSIGSMSMTSRGPEASTTNTTSHARDFEETATCVSKTVPGCPYVPRCVGGACAGCSVLVVRDDCGAAADQAASALHYFLCSHLRLLALSFHPSCAKDPGEVEAGSRGNYCVSSFHHALIGQFPVTWLRKVEVMSLRLMARVFACAGRRHRRPHPLVL